MRVTFESPYVSPYCLISLRHGHWPDSPAYLFSSPSIPARKAFLTGIPLVLRPLTLLLEVQICGISISFSSPKNIPLRSRPAFGGNSERLLPLAFSPFSNSDPEGQFECSQV